MAYFIDAVGEIVAWAAALDDGVTVGFQCLVQGHRAMKPGCFLGWESNKSPWHT